MVGGEIDKTVIGKDNASCAPRGCAEGADIAFGVASAVFIGQKAFVITEIVAADAFAGSVGFQSAARPTERGGLRFGDEITGQMTKQVNIKCDIIFGGIRPGFDDGLSGSRRGGGF